MTKIFFTDILILLIFFTLTSCEIKNNAGKEIQNETQNIINETEKVEDYATKVLKKEKNIDMTQFRKRILDLYYANNNNYRQSLDIIYPNNGKTPYKTIVLIHGGGWSGGNKQSDALAQIFQATTQGYAVVSLNYRLTNEVKWPNQLYDVKAAIRFLRAKSTKYHLDTKNLVVWGASAGGHLAEMLAATNNNPSFEDFSFGYKNFSSSVQGVVSMYGVSDLSTLSDFGAQPASKLMGFDVRGQKSKTKNADPIYLVNKDYPPLLLIHGTKDKVVPYKQSVDMQKKVNEVTGKQTAELVTFDGAGHGDAILKSNENIAKYLDFVDKILYNGKNPFRNTKYKLIKISS